MATSDTNNKIKNDNLGKVVGNFGGDYPFISINDYVFNQSELKIFEINTQRWIPEITLGIRMNHGIFLTRHFPKDGDIISVFIRSFNTLFKPIKCDFLITTIMTSPSKDSEGNHTFMKFYGILNIPNIYSDIELCLKEKTSIEALTEIANKTGLGFVSNETETNDIMNWRCSKKSYAHFIQDISNYAYKDENSWFDVWIDYYYNINFINLNKNYSINDDFEVFEGAIQGGFNTDYDGKETQFQKAKNILTNSKEANPGSQYFNSYSLTNKSGVINSILGHKNHLYFYDNNLKENIDFEISPFKTSGSEKSKIVMLGRKGEDFYKDNVRNIWMGYQFSGQNQNVHDFWKLSYIQNKYNKTEVEKLVVECSLPLANFNLYKGMVVPVMFMVQSDPVRVQVAGNKDDNPKQTGSTLDRFLTSNYVIQGINLVWKNETQEGSPNPGGSFSQEVILGRREWTMPDAPKHTYNDNPLSWSTDYPY